MKTLLELVASGTLRLDPYLVWAWLTGYRDYLSPQAPPFVAVAIECKRNVKELETSLKRTGIGVKLNSLYTNSSVVEPASIKYCTATVALDDIGALLLLVNRLELGTAIDTTQTGAGIVNETKAVKSKVVVGIIDDFVAFAHPYFADPPGFNASRVSYVWSQDPIRPDASDPSRWYAPKDLSYGFELNTFGGFNGQPKPSLSELQKAYPSALNHNSHGTSVADLASGYRSTAKVSIKDINIVAVHLPKRTVADTSGGALSVQAMDGVRYIVQRSGLKPSVVVNLSYGTMAGPHDGTSIFECALHELIKKRGGKLAVVLPAGNAYEARGHAEISLTKRLPCSTLNWFIPPDSETPAFLEIWLPQGAAECVGIEVVDPLGNSAAVASAPGVATANGAGPAASSFGIVYLKQVANGTNGSMVLIPVAPTASKNSSRVLARHGIWAVTLTLSGSTATGVIHAWIERDDTLHGQPRRGRQSYFIDKNFEMPGRTPRQPKDKPSSAVKRTGTFNTIANDRNTIVAGGYEGGRKIVATYSAATTNPPRSRLGPDVLARSEESRTLHGEGTIGNGAVGRSRINGTSAAAPHVTRQIVQWFLDPKASPTGKLTPKAIRTLLKQTAEWPKDPTDPARDAVGFMKEPLP
jgi:hypothetical protein